MPTPARGQLLPPVQKLKGRLRRPPASAPWWRSSRDRGPGFSWANGRFSRDLCLPAERIGIVEWPTLASAALRQTLVQLHLMMGEGSIHLPRGRHCGPHNMRSPDAALLSRGAGGLFGATSSPHSSRRALLEEVCHGEPRALVRVWHIIPLLPFHTRALFPNAAC